MAEIWTSVQVLLTSTKEMPRGRIALSESVEPEEMLRQATLASSSQQRAKYAQRGLAQGKRVDRTTRAMLLRQLYLSHMEARRFDRALEVGFDMIQTGVMPDVARQDAARACLGLEDTSQALEHMRIASRVSPASRRAFHLWTLGSTLYLAGRPREAVGPLARAARWGTSDRPLYEGQLALAMLAAGDELDKTVAELRERLAEAACGQGYGRFVLGELAYVAEDYEAARDHFAAFVKRVANGRVALSVALEAELALAHRRLGQLGVDVEA